MISKKYLYLYLDELMCRDEAVPRERRGVTVTAAAARWLTAAQLNRNLAALRSATLRASGSGHRHTFSGVQLAALDAAKPHCLFTSEAPKQGM